VRRRPNGVRIETKPQFADLIGRLLPERKAKPMTSQALETLAIIALKQPVRLADINAIRGIESAGTVQTLWNRKLIARTTRLGPRRGRPGGLLSFSSTPSNWPVSMSYTWKGEWSKSLLPFTAESWAERRTPLRLIVLDCLALLVMALFSDDYADMSEGIRLASCVARGSELL
jgi:hypothetical protein